MFDPDDENLSDKELYARNIPAIGSMKSVSYLLIVVCALCYTAYSRFSFFLSLLSYHDHHPGHHHRRCRHWLRSFLYSVYTNVAFFRLFPLLWF